MQPHCQFLIGQLGHRNVQRDRLEEPAVPAEASREPARPLSDSQIQSRRSLKILPVQLAISQMLRRDGSAVHVPADEPHPALWSLHGQSRNRATHWLKVDAGGEAPFPSRNRTGENEVLPYILIEEHRQALAIQ